MKDLRSFLKGNTGELLRKAFISMKMENRKSFQNVLC